MNDASVLRARFLLRCLMAMCAALFCMQANAQRGADGSLYEFVTVRIDPATGMLPANAMTLPDEPLARKYSRIRWVPGALEGLGTRHMKWDGSEKASRVARLLELIAAGNVAAEEALYDLLRADDVVTFYSDALDLAAARIRTGEPELHEMARRFVTDSTDRGPVKFGIALLGSFGDERDLPLIQTMALHDEFGLYAAEAIAEIAPDRQGALYDMARKISGWGRIEAVARMVATNDPALRRWLITDGFRNTVNPAYSAYQCATIANLAGMLGNLGPRQNADVPLLIGASDLLQALLKPGPSTTFSRYDDGPRVALAFLQNIQKRKDSVSFFLTAASVRDFVAAMNAPVPAEPVPPKSTGLETESAGPAIVAWSVEQQREVGALAEKVITDSGWRRRVVAAIGDDATDLDQAEAAAEKLGVKTFDLHLRRLTRHSTNAHRWDLAFAAAPPDDVKRLVDVAQSTFATRFADPKAHHAPNAAASAEVASADSASLEAVLRGVARYPGSGMAIVESSLADADDRVRRAAVEALVRWGGAYVRGVSVRAALNTAVNGEADEALKARMVALLNLGTIQ